MNPTTPEILREAGDLVEHLAVIPERLVYDFGPSSPTGQRFHHPRGWLEDVQQMVQGRPLTAHSFGLSLPSVRPLDGAMVSEMAWISEQLGGFDWFSEHLNVTIPSWQTDPHSNTSIALPVSYDQEVYGLLSQKLRLLRSRLNCRLLIENPATMIPLPEMEMSEPAFLNRLHRDGLSGTLLDLHNLLVSARNGGIDMGRYLEALDPAAVEEIHLAGGDEWDGFYTDSHSQLTPEELWDVAADFVPRCTNLRAITLEYNESYFEDFGIDGVVAELERMRRLCRTAATAGSMTVGGHHAA